MEKKIYYYMLFLVGFYSCSQNSVETGFQRVPADQEVQIHFKYSFGDEVNTFEKMLTKDLVLDGTITIDFWFQPDEQQIIIDTLSAIDFFSLRDSIIQNSSDSIVVISDPNPGIKSIRIQYEDMNKTVYWTYDNSYPYEWELLTRLFQTIINIIKTDAEYQNLPAPRGGYL